jgi:hypothetical protein
MTQNAEETATEVIALWLAHRPGASGRPYGYRHDAENLVERLRSSQIAFSFHGAPLAHIGSSGTMAP